MEPLELGDPRQVGSYQLLARLGAGGFGRVFLGFSEGGRPAAVKLIHAEFARDPTFVTRFGREVRAAQAVNGAYTAPVLAAGPDDSPPWLATAYVAGPSLADTVREAGPLPEQAVWKLAGGLAEALQAVHAGGLVHRDLTPQNVLLAADGPRVIDFGISRAADETVLTASGMMIGTPGFVSPEQAAWSEATPASDVFCLGSVLTFAATGTHPFGPGRRDEVLYRLVHAEPDLTGVPGALRGLISRCLSKDAARRPSLTDVLASVRGGLGSAPVAWPSSVTELVRSRENEVNAVLQSGGAVPPLPATITRPAWQPPTAAAAYGQTPTQAAQPGPAETRPYADVPLTPVTTPAASAVARRELRRRFSRPLALVTTLAIVVIVVVGAVAYSLGRASGAASGGSAQQPGSGPAGSNATSEPGYALKYDAKTFTMPGDDHCESASSTVSSVRFPAAGPQVSAEGAETPDGDLDFSCFDSNTNPGIDFSHAGGFAKVTGSPGASGCVRAITNDPSEADIDIGGLAAGKKYCLRAGSGLIVFLTLTRVNKGNFDLSWAATAWQPKS